MKAIILGASGYGGGELFRWLTQHPSIESTEGTSRANAGKLVSSVHPNLLGLVDQVFSEEIDWAQYVHEKELVVFASMPHGEFKNQYPTLEDEWKRIGLSERIFLIDLSHDFRIDPSFTYGLSEINAGHIKGSRRISNPGCFATALQLGMLPLAPYRPEHIFVSAVTGSSGSGSSVSSTTHHPTRSNDFRAYKMLSHQHEEEVLHSCAEKGWKPTLSFVPQSSSLVRGIFATIQLTQNKSMRGLDLPGIFKDFYRDKFFIRWTEGTPRILSTVGSNFADLHVITQNDKVLIMVALDNLGKGMASQAIQNMNLALGLPEWTGLRQAGPYPL